MASRWNAALVRELPRLITPRRVSDEPDRYPEAHQAYLQAIRYNREAGRPAFEAMALSNLGMLLLEQDQLEEAEAYLQEALACSVRIGRVRSQASTEELTNVAARLTQILDDPSFPDVALLPQAVDDQAPSGDLSPATKRIREAPLRDVPERQDRTEAFGYVARIDEGLSDRLDHIVGALVLLVTRG